MFFFLVNLGSYYNYGIGIKLKKLTIGIKISVEYLPVAAKMADTESWDIFTMKAVF